MKLSFWNKKTLGLSLMGSVVLSTILGISLYVGLKPPQETLSQFYQNDTLNSSELLKSQIQALNEKPKDYKVQQVMKAPKEAATDANGLNVWKYGHSAIALNDNESNLSKGTSDFFADITLRKVLNASGYKNNASFNDVVSYFAGFLNQVQPVLPNTLGNTPVAFLATNTNLGYRSLEMGVDDFSVQVQYAPAPKVHLSSIFIDTYLEFMGQSYDPLNYKSDVPIDSKIANTLQAIAVGQNSWTFAGGNPALVYANNGLTMLQDLFVKDKKDSKIFQEITAPKNIVDQNQNADAKYSALGKTVADVQKAYKKFLQRFSISYLENLKFSALLAVYKTITKPLLVNLETTDPDYLEYGYWSELSGYIGMKKSIYDAFKTVFKDTELAKSTFDGIQKADSFFVNFDGQALNSKRVTNFDYANKKFNYDTETFSSVYDAVNVRFTSDINLSFNLNTSGFILGPTVLNPATGVFDQETFDTTNTVTTNGFQKSVINLANSASSSKKLYYNGWISTNFNNTGKNGSGAYAEKSYSVNKGTAGTAMNVFSSTFFPYMTYLVQKQLDYWKKEPTKFGDASFNPIPTIKAPSSGNKTDASFFKDMSYNNFFKINYVGFYNQSRASFAYLEKPTLDANGQKMRVNLTAANSEWNAGSATWDVNNNPNSEIQFGGFQSHSLVSYTTAKTVIEIAKELFKNINDFAILNPIFNKDGKYSQYYHWSSYQEFFQAAYLYYINFGGIRNSYTLTADWFQKYGATIETGRVNNQFFAPYNATNDGKSFNPKVGMPVTQGATAYLGTMTYNNLIPFIATLLTYQTGMHQYQPVEDQNVDLNLISKANTFFYKALSIYDYNGAQLFTEKGQFSDLAKNFIKTFSTKVLGTDYHFSNLVWNAKITDFWFMYGYYDKANKLNQIWDQYSNQKIDFEVFQPKILWAESAMGLLQKNTANPVQPKLDETLNQKAAWVRNSLIVGIYSNAHLGSRANVDALHHLTFSFNQNLDFKANSGEPNGYESVMTPASFKPSTKANTVEVLVKSNNFVPGK